MPLGRLCEHYRKGDRQGREWQEIPTKNAGLIFQRHSHNYSNKVQWNNWKVCRLDSRGFLFSSTSCLQMASKLTYFQVWVKMRKRRNCNDCYAAKFIHFKWLFFIMRLFPDSFSIMIPFLLRSDDDRKCSFSFPLFKFVFILLNK